jgi:ABC-type microcin C transport system permease subunit YejB
MKKIEIDKTTYYYEIEGFNTTSFYALKSTKRKKYYLFGKEIEVPKYELICYIEYNIENPHYSKNQVLDIIKNNLKYSIQIYNRKQEIERGEII